MKIDFDNIDDMTGLFMGVILLIIIGIAAVLVWVL